MFSKILIANRGEVAVRIIRACKEMGIATVAVYSEADSEALHCSLADESCCIGPAPAKDSYLNMNAIITAALCMGAEAIHPGYGLLSENADFAVLCKENGIVFIGPEADVINKMGDKDMARKTAKAAGVPVIEGSDILSDINEAKKIASSIGYPVLLKAVSGGGGRGIRKIESENDLENAYENAAAEALAAFGDGSLYIEKYLVDVKHIEVQLLADKKGKCVILGDRDCSVQRKNQKLIEEAPAPTLPDSVRMKMYEAVRSLSAYVGYHTVGTVEFLFDGQDFYFMEMNTRLQVEHSVTEMASGIDIVKWQIRTAAGNEITFSEDEYKSNCHAIECRICAEHPFTFVPGCGTIDMLHVPGGPGVRFDSAVYQNYTIPPYYDSMIGKLIVSSKTREEAIRKMRSALSEIIMEGIPENSELHLAIMASEDFNSGNYTTSILVKEGYIK